ncbi:MAG: S8 family serine peptidase, partial [Promethearchaeota archaeon]
MILNKQIKTIFIIFGILLMGYYIIIPFYLPSNSSYNKNPDLITEKIKISNSYGKKIIVFFNKSSYNSSVTSIFQICGGSIKEEWNNKFSSFSGFAGFMPSTQNITLFQSIFPTARIENDEILQTQMNYASIQSGAINSTWYYNGYKGNDNCSVAVIDTGINPNHQFFPNGYSPLNFKADIIGSYNFISSDPILDDNGHGTFISSVISGTGKDPYKLNTPVTVQINGNYSHTELFNEYTPAKNYSLKIFSFNASVPDSQIIINSSWNWEVGGIDKFWFELYYNNALIGKTHNQYVNDHYILNYTIPQTKLGIHDLYIKYHKRLQSKPVFSFNSSIEYFPEKYIENFNHFTGIANATKIVSYKILNQSGIGYSSDLISALGHVIHNRSKYHIVSVCLSIRTLGEDVGAVNRAITEVIDNGVLVVIAAGNEGIKTSDSLNKLAKNKKAIIVGATNDKDQVTSYSSMGKDIGPIRKPDLVAPGGSKLDGHRTIISADKESNKITSNYGTSISTAIVSAAINLLIEAKWNNWNQWNSVNLAQMVKYLKAILLMTASETNLEREDDPSTTEDESDFSPTLSLDPFITGLKDVHEGYGRINIQAAINALTKSLVVNSTVSAHLESSKYNPLGTHVFARQIQLIEDTQYLFNLSTIEKKANFDIFLFSNGSNQYGEPILLGASRNWYGDYFYFTPKENQTKNIVIIKAINGSSQFTLKVSPVKNNFSPVLDIPEITYFGGSKNTTIMSFQEFIGSNPKKNYSIDTYRFYIDYFDNDTSNVPPQEVYVSVLGISKNYSLYQFYPPDNNYTDGALFVSDYIQLPKPGVYQYVFIATDGKFHTVFPEIGYLNISIEFPTDSLPFPSEHNFNEGIGNWTYTGTGWALLQQSNNIDNRSRVYNSSWNSLYFGTYHDYPKNYTYQPIKITEDPFPNGTLTSPLLNLTKLSNDTKPFAKFGLRTSINSGDFVYLQINLNWTGWFTLRIYTNEEREWFIEEINLTEYVGNFIQFRFETSLDETFDALNYKGFILDFFTVENFTNYHSPSIKFSIGDNLPINQESKYHQFTFSFEYFDLDNNYPDYTFLEIDNTNFTMYNIFGDWNASSNSLKDFGILFTRSLNLEDFSNLTFRFHISDGKFENSTNWYNENGTLFEFINPNPLNFNIFKDGKFIGYKFSNNNLSEYYVAGNPRPKEFTTWLGGDNTWHPIYRLGQHFIYGGIGQSYGSAAQGYGMNWDSKLITKPLKVTSEYPIYLEYDYDISLQNEFYQPEDQLDRGIISISKDFGYSWKVLKEYTYESEPLYGRERFDISEYSGEDVMIMFTLNTNNIVLGLGFGWLLSNIYIGYDESTDFIAPEIEILSPKNGTRLNSTIIVKANITDNVGLDESRIYIFINGKSVDRSLLVYNSNTSILEFNWNTNRYNDGNYEVKIVAYDKEGNMSESSVAVSVYNGKFWKTWGPYIILIISVIVVGVILYIIGEKRGKIWIDKIREARIEKMRLSDVDKDQIIKKIEVITQDEELKRPLTLYCKHCKSWFSSMEFDIICPICEYDQIYATYICTNCNSYYFKEEPGENYYCKNKNCRGIRLIRREKE